MQGREVGCSVQEHGLLSGDDLPDRRQGAFPVAAQDLGVPRLGLLRCVQVDEQRVLADWQQSHANASSVDSGRLQRRADVPRDLDRAGGVAVQAQRSRRVRAPAPRPVL